MENPLWIDNPNQFVTIPFIHANLAGENSPNGILKTFPVDYRKMRNVCFLNCHNLYDDTGQCDKRAQSYYEDKENKIEKEYTRCTQQTQSTDCEHQKHIAQKKNKRLYKKQLRTCRQIEQFQANVKPLENCLSYCENRFPDNVTWPTPDKNDDISYCGSLDNSDKYRFYYLLIAMFVLIGLSVIGWSIFMFRNK